MAIRWENRELITAARLNAANPRTALKSRNQARTLNASPSGDDELYVECLAGLTYDIFGLLRVSSAANAAGDIQVGLAWVGNDTGTGTWAAMGPDSALASGSSAGGEWLAINPDTSSPTAFQGFGCSTTVNSIHLRGRLVAALTDLAVGVIWTQLASNANATNVLAGSWLTAKPVL